MWVFLKLLTRSATIFLHTNYIITGYRVKQIHGYITSYQIVYRLFYWKERHQTAFLAVMSGVPQGSLLGPSLFLFYINDIPDGMTSTVRLFADDTIAYLTIKTNRDCTTLQNDLDKLSSAYGNKNGKWPP